jgi:dihydroxy-acid dehydratase
MPEMLTPTSALAGYGLLNDVAPHHRRPLQRRQPWLHHRPRDAEAIEGGNIALAKNGDKVRIDSDRNTIDLLVVRRRAGRRRRRVEAPAVQGDARDALQVHQEREERQRRVREADE